MPQNNKRVPLSLFKQHVENWKDCKKCHLHETRQRVVFARGKVPCDVLLIAEAPGHSEDSIGIPMIGPAGKVMDDIIARSIGINPQTRWCITNMICCIPIGEDGYKTEQPEYDSIMGCQPRLVEFVNICKPWLIVCVGDVADKWIKSRYFEKTILPDITSIKIAHPAAILRVPDAHRALAVQKCVVEIRNAVDDMLEQMEMNLLQKTQDRSLKQTILFDDNVYEKPGHELFPDDEPYSPLFPEEDIPF